MNLKNTGIPSWNSHKTINLGFSLAYGRTKYRILTFHAVIVLQRYFKMRCLVAAGKLMRIV